MDCVDIRVATHCDRDVSDIVEAVVQALRARGYRAEVSRRYPNRSGKGYRVYIRVRGAARRRAVAQNA